MDAGVDEHHRCVHRPALWTLLFSRMIHPQSFFKEI